MYQKKLRALRTIWQGLSGNARGSVWLLTGGLCATIMITGIKFVGQRLPVIEILFFRQMFVFLFLGPVIVREFPAAFRTKRLKMHVSRCLINFHSFFFNCLMIFSFVSCVFGIILSAPAFVWPRTIPRFTRGLQCFFEDVTISTDGFLIASMAQTTSMHDSARIMFLFFFLFFGRCFPLGWLISGHCLTPIKHCFP